jgi:NhaA family Na+:H+ antiporter
MKLTKLFKDFFESEKASGLILIFCTIISLLLTNSSFQEQYHALWHLTVFNNSVEHWINDGLMAIFFLLIGLELEREVYAGELSSLKNAMLPVVAALGGMLVPAGFYLLFNYQTETASGAGIPMATDIAFALGVLSLLGNRIHVSLKIFLTALAVIDDLGAIIVIAIFYTKTIVWTNLITSLSIFAFLLILNRIKVRNLIPYLIGGVFMWYFMLHSGIHAAITGVLLAFAIPFGKGDAKSTSYILQHLLHKPVAFLILPLFALANTAIVIHSGWESAFREPFAKGILSGLILGKPIGIILFSFLSVYLGLCSLPKDLNWKHVSGAGFLAGIGFTMSIFITLLAFDKNELINNSKLMILVASLAAALIGFVWLWIVTRLGKRILSLD